MHFTVTIYYNIISKFQKIAKNSKMVRSKKSKCQVSEIMLDANMKFQNYPIKTVGKMHFTVTIYYTSISKISKIRQKLSDRKTRLKDPVCGLIFIVYSSFK